MRASPSRTRTSLACAIRKRDFLIVNATPRESRREKQRRSRWKKGRTRHKAKFESAILIRTATLIGEPN